MTASSVPCAAVKAAQTIARLAHWRYVSHLNRCDTVIELGRPCSRCQEFLDAADDAGKRWDLAVQAARALEGAR